MREYHCKTKDQPSKVGMEFHTQSTKSNIKVSIASSLDDHPLDPGHPQFSTTYSVEHSPLSSSPQTKVTTPNSSPEPQF